MTTLDPWQVIVSAAAVILVISISHWFKKEIKQVQVKIPKEIQPEWKSEIITDQTVVSDSGIQCYDPATGKILGYCSVINPDEVLHLIKRARAAQTAFKQYYFLTEQRLQNGDRSLKLF